MYTRVKTTGEIEAMRTGGQMLAQVLSHLKTKVKAGISTQELNDIAAKELGSLGGQAAFLGYKGFPGSICISVNDEVVHGIPKPDKFLDDGDVVSLDMGVIYKGLITDSAVTVVCGREPNNLVKFTQQALEEGINVAQAGCHVGDIGQAIQSVLDKQGFGIVRDLVGHGVGHAVHEDPNIPNYGRSGSGPQLSRGMTVAIEPMATLGREAVVLDPDGWTVRTRDGSAACHFEHTVLITEDGCEVLTLADITP